MATNFLNCEAADRKLEQDVRELQYSLEKIDNGSAFLPKDYKMEYDDNHCEYEAIKQIFGVEMKSDE